MVIAVGLVELAVIGMLRDAFGTEIIVSVRDDYCIFIRYYRKPRY